MIATHEAKHSLEVLESRIAPASLIATAKFIPAAVGGPTLLHAGQGLGTSSEYSGIYLLYVEKGDCLVFTTDFNNNGAVDFNEITGIAAGDGLRLISFVNISGDIVTNLRPNGTLSDSDNNSTNDDPFLKGDGRKLLNSTIESITLRSVTADDFDLALTGDVNNDGQLDDADLQVEAGLRLALSSYSLFGSIYAGKGFGVEGDATSGLTIDNTGSALQDLNFGTGLGADYNPSSSGYKSVIGSIKTGTATSNEFFNFGASNKTHQQGEVHGYLNTFVPPVGQSGGDIIGVRSATNSSFNIDALIAGDGGTGARGGSIKNVALNSDTAGGYKIIAGNGGRGANGGAGGSIIDFSDAGSITSQIVIRSGDGGTASTGAGGNGGNISLGAMNVNGGLGITLGSGGDGFTAGGNGASLSKAIFTTPEGAIAYTGTIVSSAHDPRHDPATGMSVDPITAASPAAAAIGRAYSIDFDHDGIGDMVFTGKDPDQLVVDFGDGFGTFRSDPTSYGTNPELFFPGQPIRLYLGGVNNPDALTVGDFNGDGFYDIAVGSHSPGNFDGIVVFLAKTEDANHDGVLSTAEDADHDGVIDFVGFESPIRSQLPTLQHGDPDGGLLIDTLYYGYYRSAVAIADIQAGDFNGDGFTDLAVAAIYTHRTIEGPKPFPVFMVLTANLETTTYQGVPQVRPTGQFFTDVGTKASTFPAQPAVTLTPFTPFGTQTMSAAGGFDAIIEASGMQTGATIDTLIGGTFGAGSFVLSMNFIGGSANITQVGLPKVDTDRSLDGVSIADPLIQDFTISDTNRDGFADITVLVSEPKLFVVAAQGDGTGAFPKAIIGGAGNNSGALLTEIDNALGGNPVVIRNSYSGGFLDHIAITWSNFPNPGTHTFDVADAPSAPPPAANTGHNGSEQLTGNTRITNLFGDDGVAMDIYFTDATIANPTINTFIVGEGNNPPPVEVITNSVGFVYPVEHYFRITSGDGGDALVGRGGVGGSIGKSLAAGSFLDPSTGQEVNDLVGSITILLPANRDFNGVVDFIAGHGGNGLSVGGKGGSVNGVVVRYVTLADGFSSFVNLHAGDGGFGLAGVGGAGGDLLANSIQSGFSFEAGNGGRGVAGGRGGSIVGNGFSNFYDAEFTEQVLLAGTGGDGVKSGGAGGDIVNFHGLFDLTVVGANAGLLSHTAGAGGNAISGPGGNGGDVVNSTPLPGVNFLAGNITLTGGRGGNGKTGGNGGNVRDFTDKPSTQDNPAILTFIGGDGGDGTRGRGGKGGNLLNIDTPSLGKQNQNEIPDQPYPFNRFLAGDGGKSAGAAGGDGGDILHINTVNTENPFVMVSGAGGSGLTRGGNGGDVSDVLVQLGTENSNKALIIAGAGGSAAAWIPNPANDNTPGQPQKAFGGRIGVAGNGGSILHLTQKGSIGARIDLIAGNGGDTINYGSVIDKKIAVGKGGSIIDVHLDSNIGNIQANIPLKSYNDVLNGETVQDFVTANLRNPLVPGSIDDNIGMVGAVVGSAGRIKKVPNSNDPDGFRSQPANGGVNGSMLNVSARNIASAIAGAPERIASIQVVGNIKITASGGILGKDFDDTIDPTKYRDPMGNPVPEPLLDGSLVDGALVYKNEIKGDTLPGGHHFQLGGK